MKKSDLAKIVRETVRGVIKEQMASQLPVGGVPDDMLDDATELLMMVSGRIMSAKDNPVNPELIAQAVHHIEQADGLLAKAGLKADSEIAGMDEGAGLSPRDWAVMAIQQQAQEMKIMAKHSDLDDQSLQAVADGAVALVKKLKGYA
jgi:hypothetical protein